MISDSVIQKIEAHADQVASQFGVRIYDIEFGNTMGGRALQIFIDKEGGVGVEDCANVSRGLNEILDEMDLPGNYNLEVSSPGLDRVLKKDWHYQQAVGKRVYVVLKQSLESLNIPHKRLKTAKKLEDILVAFENNTLKFRIDEEDILVPFSEIEKGKMVFDINEGKDTKNPKNKHRI